MKKVSALAAEGEIVQMHRLYESNKFLSIFSSLAVVFVMLLAAISTMPVGDSAYPGDIVLIGEMIVTKTKGSPAESASSMQFVPELSGLCWATIFCRGLKSVQVIIRDVSDPAKPVKLFDEKILFTGNRKPIADTSQVQLSGGRTYQLTAIPSGSEGTYAIVRCYIEYGNSPPVARFECSVRSLFVQVDASGSYDDGVITDYIWDWNDGTCSYGMTATHIYGSEGIKTITLTVIDNAGLSGTATLSVNLINLKPVAIIVAPDVGDVGIPLYFQGTASYDPDGTIVSYIWDFGDGSIETGCIVSHEYLQEGQYVVTLTVTDEFGKSNSAAKLITIGAPQYGRTEKTWIISHMFVLTKPDYDYNRTGGITFEELGRHTDKDMMAPWYVIREPNYGQYIYRSTYPHIFYGNPYSTMTVPDVNIGNVAWAPYRLRIVAKNVTDCNTRDGAIFIPDLDDSRYRPNGGFINASFYGTYMTSAELKALRGGTIYGTHYARWFFGLSGVMPPYGSLDDGYWYQLMVKVQYSKEAAMTYLGWDGTGDVRNWYVANDANIESAWFDYWMAEGNGGWADIYTAYDYPEDIRAVAIVLDSLNSTADSLTICVWTMSWGMDAQIIRYLEKAGLVRKGFQGFMEDMYLNLSITPYVCNAELRGTVTYDMMAWADTSGSGYIGAWMLEAHHIDWCGNIVTHPIPISPYNAYDPDVWDWLRPSLAPWTVNFGKNVSYWKAPLEFDLAPLERIIIELPKDDIIGFNPGRAASDDLSVYLQNLRSNEYWGQMTVGSSCYPDMMSYYDPFDKKIYLFGPIDFPPALHPLNPNLLLNGVPMFVFRVA